MTNVKVFAEGQTYRWTDKNNTPPSPSILSLSLSQWRTNFYPFSRFSCSAGAIAGGVIGALTAIAIVAGIIGYCYISKKKKKKEEEEMDEGFDFNMSK